MRELNRYDFSNDRSFITYLLSEADTRRMRIPDRDVIGLRRRVISPTDSEQPEGPMYVMRPDEALILARLLIDAVWQVTEGYTIGEPKLDTEAKPPTYSVFKKHGRNLGCRHHWMRRDDNSMLCPKCDTVSLPPPSMNNGATTYAEGELNIGGIPIVSDSTVPKDEIHLRQNGKTEAVLKVSDNGVCREVWRSSNTR